MMDARQKPWKATPVVTETVDCSRWHSNAVDCHRFGETAMNDPMLEEIYEVRRKLWEESDGTLEGYSRHCEAVARDFRARVAAETAGKQGAAKRRPGVRRRAPARGKKMIARKENEETAK